MNALAKSALTVLVAAGLPAHSGAQPPATYSGPCDASAAVALDAAYFVVGDDERNTLHVYRQGQAQAVGSLDLSKFLATDVDEESDIEGAAAVGTRIYWITSHGRNSKGKARPSRHRFFAIEVLPGQPPTLKPVGQAYVDLLRDMTEADTLKPYRLGDAARPREADARTTGARREKQVKDVRCRGRRHAATVVCHVQFDMTFHALGPHPYNSARRRVIQCV